MHYWVPYFSPDVLDVHAADVVYICCMLCVNMLAILFVCVWLVLGRYLDRYWKPFSFSLMYEILGALEIFRLYGI